MKVLFHGRYSDVLPLIDVPKGADVVGAGKAGFATVLAERAQVLSQPIDNNSKTSKHEVSLPAGTASDLPPMASLRPQSTVSLSLPEPKPIISEKIEGMVVNEPAESVKTPAVLEVNRIYTAVQSGQTGEQERAKVQESITQAGQKHRIDPALSMAVAKAESSFNPAAISSDGHASKGIFQLLDRTGAHLMEQRGLSQSYNPFNVDQNVDLGVGYLRYLHDIFSSPTQITTKRATVAAENLSSLEKLAVASFNAGEGRVAGAQARAGRDGLNPAKYEHVEEYLPESTREYVKRVMSTREQFVSAQLSPFEQEDELV